MVLRRRRAIPEPSIRLTELKGFLETQELNLKEALRILDTETIDDIFYVGKMLKDTESLLKKVNADIKKKSNT